jgi:hypothetical protein
MVEAERAEILDKLAKFSNHERQVLDGLVAGNLITWVMLSMRNLRKFFSGYTPDPRVSPYELVSGTFSELRRQLIVHLDQLGR